MPNRMVKDGLKDGEGKGREGMQKKGYVRGNEGKDFRLVKGKEMVIEQGMGKEGEYKGREGRETRWKRSER